VDVALLHRGRETLKRAAGLTMQALHPSERYNRLSSMMTATSLKSEKKEDMNSLIANAQADAQVKKSQSHHLNSEGTRYIEFRQWKNLDELFESLGPHPLTQSEIYTNRVVRTLWEESGSIKRHVTLSNAFIGMQVRRGPDWCWGNQDGGPAPGSTGNIVSVDRAMKVATVFWKETNMSRPQYRIGRDNAFDLDMPEVVRSLPTPLVCADLANNDITEEQFQPNYVPFSKLVDKTEARDVVTMLKYASCNGLAEPVPYFKDAHPSYNIGEDFWGKIQCENPNDYFTKRCTRSESVWA